MSIADTKIRPQGNVEGKGYNVVKRGQCRLSESSSVRRDMKFDLHCIIQKGVISHSKYCRGKALACQSALESVGGGGKRKV